MGNDVEWTASRLWASLGSGIDSPFCFFFWLWIHQRWWPLFWSYWHRCGGACRGRREGNCCCGTRSRSWTRVRYNTGRPRCTSGKSRCIDWWRARWCRSQKWFWIQDHVGRDASMWYQGRRTFGCRARYKSVQASGVWMIKTEIGRRRRFIIFDGGLEERQETCQVVEMHDSSSQMMMERSSLSMIHERSNESGAKGKRSLSQGADGGKQEATERQQQRERTGRNKEEERGKNKRKHTHTHTRTHTRPEPGQPWKARGRKSGHRRRATGRNSAGGEGNERTSRTNLRGETDLPQTEHTPKPHDNIRRGTRLEGRIRDQMGD